MKKITLLFSFLMFGFFSITSVQSQSKVSSTVYETIQDFESYTIGDAVPYYVYWSTTTAASGTCQVAADPTNSANKTVEVIPTDYNGTVTLSVTLPTGKTLQNYDYLYFDLYFDSSTGLYAQPYIYADATKIEKVESGYPSQGTNATWNTKEYALTNMPASNSFNLKIGYTSNNSVTYYLDNIKLRESESTGVNNVSSNPMVIYYDGAGFKMNQTVEKADLYDLKGSKLMSVVNTNTMPVTNLDKGVYLIKSTVNGQNYVSKVVR